jgi:large subunit ribosomal protein L17
MEHERIETTVAKAKEVRKMAEKIVTLGKKGDLNSRRLAFSYVPNKGVIEKLFDEIAPRFSDRNGGYTRIIKTRSRIKDNAPMAVLEFVDYESRKMAVKMQGEKKETGAAKQPAKKKPASPKKIVNKESAEKKAAPKKKTSRKKADEE